MISWLCLTAWFNLVKALYTPESVYAGILFRYVQYCVSAAHVCSGSSDSWLYVALGSVWPGSVWLGSNWPGSEEVRLLCSPATLLGTGSAQMVQLCVARLCVPDKLTSSLSIGSSQETEGQLPGNLTSSNSIRETSSLRAEWWGLNSIMFNLVIAGLPNNGVTRLSTRNTFSWTTLSPYCSDTTALPRTCNS